MFPVNGGGGGEAGGGGGGEAGGDVPIVIGGSGDAGGGDVPVAGGEGKVTSTVLVTTVEVLLAVLPSFTTQLMLRVLSSPPLVGLGEVEL